MATIEAAELVSGEFQWISRTNDVLLKVQSQKHGDFLALTEVQMHPDRRMDVRTNAYSALAREKYDLPVFAAILNILPPAAGVEIAICFHSEFLGQSSHRDFKVINLWEVDASMVFEHQLTSLLPFVPVMRSGQDEQLITQAVVRLRADENLSELEALLAFFSRFVLSAERVIEIMRWDMLVLRESPWYNDLLQEGMQMGIEKGLEQGLEQGLEHERVSMLLHILEHRFGPLPESVVQRIHGTPADDLRRLVDVAIDAPDLATVSGFMATLPVKSHTTGATGATGLNEAGGHNGNGRS